MKFRNNLVVASIPVLMILSGSVYAGTCSDPCDINTIGDPRLRLNDTDGSGSGDQDWEIQNVGAGINSTLEFGLVGAAPKFVIEDDTATNMLVLDASNRVGIGTNAPGETLEINSSQPGLRLKDNSTGAGFADLEMSTHQFFIQNETNRNVISMETNGGSSQDNQIYLDSTGRVGIKVANPVASLQVGNGGDILLENGTEDWALQTDSGAFRIRRGNNTVFGTAPFIIEDQSPTNSLVIDDSGKIGVGTTTPSSDITVRRIGAQMHIKDLTGTVGPRKQMILENNGVPIFSLVNSSTGKSWDFTQTQSGDFTISRAGSGGFEFQFQGDGRVKMSNGPTVNFNLSPSGDLSIPNGSVTANGILLTSTVTSKTDIEPINPASFMEKLKKIEVAEWRYKKADKNDRHISPMAENFYSLFQLGPDNKHINPNDLASVALIASKELQKKSEALHAKSEALDSKTEALIVENTALKQRLATLEKLVTNLASSGNALPSNGEKVASSK